jgi:hypothetical protein
MAKKAAKKKTKTLKAKVSDLRTLQGDSRIKGGLKGNTKL